MYLCDCATDRWGAGGDASVAELESAGTRDPKWLIDRANVFLQAGAYVRCSILNRFPYRTKAKYGIDDNDRE
jgi:hypothetical protein